VDNRDPLVRLGFAPSKQRFSGSIDSNQCIGTTAGPTLEYRREFLPDYTEGTAKLGSSEFWKDLVQVQNNERSQTLRRLSGGDQEVRQCVHMNYCCTTEPVVITDQPSRANYEVQILNQVAAYRTTPLRSSKANDGDAAMMSRGGPVLPVAQAQHRYPQTHFSCHRGLTPRPRVIRKRAMRDVNHVKGAAHVAEKCGRPVLNQVVGVKE
jgi:hypothetical protein